MSTTLVEERPSKELSTIASSNPIEPQAARIAPRRPLLEQSNPFLNEQTDESRHDAQILDNASYPETFVVSKARTAAIIASVTLISFISAMLNGTTTVALPELAVDLDIPPSLILWPSSIQALTNACALLISGSLADALGARFIYLVGCILQAGFILGCGLSRTSTELLVSRALSGIAISLCMPSAVSIITKSFVGKRRDFAFAAMGGGFPIGFSVGLTVGGVFTDKIGWRWAFHTAFVFNVFVLAIGFWGLPASLDSLDQTNALGVARKRTWSERWNSVKHDIDWVGAIIGSTALGLLSYVFAALTGSTSNIKEPSTIAMLSVAFALIPVFVAWVGRQEKLGRPAIIPNSLWRNTVFTTICFAVFLTWGTFNSVETILTFFFQDVQKLSATEASIRFLPTPVCGFLANVVTGALVHRVPAHWMILIGCVLSAIAPLVMAFATPGSNYWATAFVANAVNPAGADILFTISNLVITSVFPAKTQALAGGVFNSISQMGKSVGLALTAVIAASVTSQSHFSNKRSPDALMKGYAAAFWYSFAVILATLAISLWGLRAIGKVGHKRD